MAARPRRAREFEGGGIVDAFEAYGSSVAPTPMDRRPDRRAKAPSKLDLKMEEKARLTKSYKILKRKERIEILAEEPRLLDFMRYLRKVTAETGDELLEAIEACDWLMRASQKARGFALSRIAVRSDRLRLQAGELPLDDPLPPETSVFFEAQKLLRQGGVL